MSSLSIDQIVDAVRNEIATKGKGNVHELVKNYCDWSDNPKKAEDAVWKMIEEEF